MLRVMTRPKGEGKNGTLNLCMMVMLRGGDTVHKCGTCGCGNMAPRVGYKCKVCGAKVAEVRLDPDDNWELDCLKSYP